MLTIIYVSKYISSNEKTIVFFVFNKGLLTCMNFCKHVFNRRVYLLHPKVYRACELLYVMTCHPNTLCVKNLPPKIIFR